MSLWLREEQKAQPPGYASSGWGGGPQFSDAFRFRRSPSPPALVEAYKSLIWTCTSLNSDAVARVPLRLYRIGQSKGDVAKRCDARRVSKGIRHRLKSLSYAAKAMAGAEELEEITGDFPLLELIQNVNPAMDNNQLIRYTSMSMDVVGTGFWWPTEFNLGCPREFWPLPPHLVSPEMVAGGLVPSGYQFGSILYKPEDLLIFKHLSMKNPYGLGMSPTQAAIEYARLEDTFVSIQDDLLSNGPRPSVVVSHKDPQGAFGPAERKRLEDDMNRKGRGGRSGGAFVVDGAVSITPITWSPADLGAVEISKYDLERTCGCFGVPVSMVTNESSNKAVAQAGLEQHARQAVDPRCKNIASTLTRWTHSLDKGGQKNWHKLVWAFDDCIPEDDMAAAELHAKYFAMGLPPNVGLTEAGYDAVEGGDTSFIASGFVTLENALKPPEPPPAPGQMPGEDPNAPPEREPLTGDHYPDPDDEPAPEPEPTEDQATQKSMGLIVWDPYLKRYVPCRAANGRFASCGSAGAKPDKPKPGSGGGKKPSKKPAKPKTPKDGKKPAAPKKPGEKPEAKPAKKPADKPEAKPEKKPPGKPVAADKPKPAEPAKPTDKPAEAKPEAAPTKPESKPREFTSRESAHPSKEQSEAMSNFANEEFGDWHAKLGDAEKKSLATYQSHSGYKKINGGLREGKTPPQVAGLDSAIAQGSLKSDTSLYRGVFSASQIGLPNGAKAVGSTISDKAYMSTSLDSGIAKHFTSANGTAALIRIQAPAGTKAAMVGKTDKNGKLNAKEHEVLLARGSGIKITKYHGLKDGVHHYDAELAN